MRAAAGRGRRMRDTAEPLDPRSAVPLTKQALEQIEKTDPFRLFGGTTYRPTSGNRLPRDWILETPDVWGEPAAAVKYVPLDCKKCDTDFHLPVCRAPPDCRTGRCGELLASVARPGERPRRFCLGPADRLIDAFYTLVISAQQSVRHRDAGAAGRRSVSRRAARRRHLACL